MCKEREGQSGSWYGTPHDLMVLATQQHVHTLSKYMPVQREALSSMRLALRGRIAIL